MRKVRQKIIKVITWIAAVMFVLFATALDSGGWTPIFVCGGCAVWLLIVCISNTSDK